MPRLHLPRERAALAVPLLQSQQNVNVPFFLPPLLALGAFLVTLFYVDLALPLLVVATALDRYRFDMGGGGLRVEHFVFIGVALAWFLRVRPTWGAFHSRRSDLLLVAYLALALLASVLFAPQLGESVKFIGLMAFGVALYWLVGALGSMNERNFVRGFGALIVVGVAASAFGLLAWLVYPLGLDLGVQTYSLENLVTFSPYGTLFDSNTLGLYAMAAVLLQITLLLDPQFAKWRAPLAVCILVTLSAVALSLTRAAWIGLAVGLVLSVLASPRRRLALAVGGVACGLVILALVANSALAGGSDALAEFSIARVLAGRSILFRLDAYTRAWSDFLASPLLGSGANVFAQKYTSPAGSRDWISNFVLMTLHDTGIVGLALLGGWLVWIAVETRVALARAQGMTRTFILALSIAYVALLVTYQATTVFWLGWNWIYLGLLRAGWVRVRE